MDSTSGLILRITIHSQLLSRHCACILHTDYYWHHPLFFKSRWRLLPSIHLRLSELALYQQYLPATNLANNNYWLSFYQMIDLANGLHPLSESVFTQSLNLYTHNHKIIFYRRRHVDTN